jgi:hypothetical protein
MQKNDYIAEERAVVSFIQHLLPVLNRLSPLHDFFITSRYIKQVIKYKNLA